MTVQIHTGADPVGDDLATCEVVTVDAAGRERWYEIDLTNDDTFDDGYLMASAQIEGPGVGGHVGASELAYQAAREHFGDLGYEVHG